MIFRPMMLAAVAVMVLAACSPASGLKLLNAGDEALQGTVDLVDEITDDRETNRAAQRVYQGKIVSMWDTQATLAIATGEFGKAEAFYDQILDRLETQYPDLVDFVEEIDRINDAIEAARADDP